MKIQANAQTNDGVWGVMLSGWVGDDDAAKKENVFSQWMTLAEATALMTDLTDSVVGKSSGPPNSAAPEGNAK